MANTAWIEDLRMKQAFADREREQERQAFLSDPDFRDSLRAVAENLRRDTGREDEDAADRAYEAWCAEQYRNAMTVTEPGFYLHNERVYRCQVSRSSGHLYALVLTIDPAAQKGRFEYAAGAVRELLASERLTVTEAARLGHHYGICVVCGATLTDPASVAQGIGPVCIKKLA